MAFFSDNEHRMVNNEVEIYYQCERLIYRFLQLLQADQAATADLFTEDAQAFTLNGRQAIREHFAGIAKVDHNVNVNLSSNLIVEVEDEDHATATNYVTHYVSDPVTDVTVPMGGPVGGETSIPRTITRWSWTFLRIEGEWLISKMAYPGVRAAAQGCTRRY